MTPGAERDAAVRRLLPLVGSIARGLTRVYRCGDYQDVFQDGCLGMIRAVGAYDPERGVPLEAYARPIIAGAIVNGIRGRDPLSDHARGLLRTAEREREAAAIDGAPTPLTMQQMATRLSGLGAAMLMAHRANVVSLDERLPGGETLPVDWSNDPAHLVSEREDRVRLQAALETLTERQRSVIAAYYFADKTVQVVGEDFNVSAQRVSQLHRTALTNMRKCMAEQ